MAKNDGKDAASEPEKTAKNTEADRAARRSRRREELLRENPDIAALVHAAEALTKTEKRPTRTTAEVLAQGRTVKEQRRAALKRVA